MKQLTLKAIEIITENRSEYMTVLAVLLYMGYRWHSGPKDPKNVDDIMKRYYPQYPVIVVHQDKKELVARQYHYHDNDMITAQEFMSQLDKLFTDDQIFLTIKLTDDYDAYVYPDRVEVGCQVISLEACDVLAKAIEAMRATPPTI